MDSELDDHEASAALAELRQPELHEKWRDYHLIGDALRGAPVELSPEFSQSLSRRLAQEPAILAPRSSGFTRRPVIMLAAASLAAVMLVGWMMLQLAGIRTDVTIVAKQTPPAPTPAANSPSPEVNRYLIAHQEFSPATVVQGGMPYVRMVSEEEWKPAQ